MRPAWEVDLLSRGLAVELGDPEDTPRPRGRKRSPFASIPDSLKVL